MSLSMLNPDFPFSYDHYLPAPRGWARFPGNITAPR